MRNKLYKLRDCHHGGYNLFHLGFQFGAAIILVGKRTADPVSVSSGYAPIGNISRIITFFSVFLFPWRRSITKDVFSAVRTSDQAGQWINGRTVTSGFSMGNILFQPLCCFCKSLLAYNRFMHAIHKNNLAFIVLLHNLRFVVLSLNFYCMSATVGDHTRINRIAENDTDGSVCKARDFYISALLTLDVFIIKFLCNVADALPFLCVEPENFLDRFRFFRIYH